MTSPIGPGTRAIVTGASWGIGETFAEALASRGADLLLVARSEDRLQEMATELAGQHGVRVEVVTLDLAEPDGPRRLCEAADALGFEPTLLVNNAGIGVLGPFARPAAGAGPRDDPSQRDGPDRPDLSGPDRHATTRRRRDPQRRLGLSPPAGPELRRLRRHQGVRHQLYGRALGRVPRSGDPGRRGLPRPWMLARRKARTANRCARACVVR